MQNGPRISAFEVDDGRLISINCGILCGNDEILEGNKANSSKSSNVIFLSAEGLFYVSFLVKFLKLGIVSPSHDM